MSACHPLQASAPGSFAAVRCVVGLGGSAAASLDGIEVNVHYLFYKMQALCYASLNPAVPAD
jgi:hypothetical protein